MFYNRYDLICRCRLDVGVKIHAVLGKKICIKGVDNDSIHRFPDGCDLLVIAGNTHQSLSRLRQIYSPKRIVIHPGIYDYRREKLFSEAHKSGIDYYDLDDSPLRLLDE